MSMGEFIRQNREEIDRYIRDQVEIEGLADEERRLWVLNDEGLYNWARSEGVKI
jgi:hypothetical protein